MLKRVVLAVLFTALAVPAVAQEKIKTVATFSILADVVKNVGGDRVAVTALVGPNSDAHVYQPSPSDAKTLADAKVVFTNGLGFEGWMERLIKASGTKAAMVVASKGVKPRNLEPGADGHQHATDPHAWQAVGNIKLYAGNIRDALVAADPAGKADYEANAKAYLAKLDALDAEIRAEVGKIPADRRRIITTHDAFGYFAAAYGVAFIAPQGVSTEFGGLRQGRRQDHHADQAAEDSGRVPGERHRRSPAEAHRGRERRQGRRHALFGRADRREGRGADLYRHDAAQHPPAHGGADELIGAFAGPFGMPI